ncbi:MAG: hypothetical protein MPI95_04575 [Nitrosopumilus sp.]|nr:hypothetical protein [Nitrosopumilus sp.]CAI9830819.1 conserved hypothetical protein [Nitrosopumilaceae archaeon]MDA7941074.1 hypothetical protein [Nitrosopumilus sp.]MDA7942528.1 hypothetical protein [Nitrosopumilus sp.]MDA7944513.1 hypothetical protein [Nitrosopumilus sp.]
MARKSIKIDAQDASGTTYSFKMEGDLASEKVKQVLDMMDLLNIEEEAGAREPATISSKIWHIVDRFFPMGRFTSSNVLEKFEDEFGPIQPAMISTYLARFSSKGMVNRVKTGKEWTYTVIPAPVNRS